MLFLSVTVVGHAATTESLVLRSGATAGDVLAVTGALGAAAAGLLLVQRGGLRQTLPSNVAEALVDRQLEPLPRLAAGRALTQAGATAMIDISDGLFADAGLLAAASKVAVQIDAALLPVAEGVAEVAREAGIDRLALVGGGEDYELLVALPEGRFEEAAQAAGQAGAKLTRIGSVIKGGGLTLQGPEGKLKPPAGYDHLA